MKISIRLRRLANLSTLNLVQKRLDAKGDLVHSTAQFDLRIHYEVKVDREAETSALNKEIDRLAKDIETKQKRLADDSFRARHRPKSCETSK